MSFQFRACTLDQPLLLAPSLQQWLPEGHLARFLADVTEQLDLSAIYSAYDRPDGRGQAGYHPLLLTRLLLYGYCVGVASSRAIERKTYEDVAFRYLAADQHPDHDTIANFRKQHLARLGELFVQALQLCQKAGLVKLGHVAIDGTKIQANASKHKAMSYGRMGEAEQKLQAEVETLLRHAEEVDEAEDRQYGKGQRGDELPAELARRESRLKKIREAKELLSDNLLGGKKAAECASVISAFLINRAAAGDGAENARFGELRGWHFGEIVRKDDEVGVLVLLQFTFLPFLELRVSRTRSVRANAILERDFLLRLPAVFRTALRAFARNAGVQAAKGADGLHVIVRSKRHRHTVLQHGGPGIGAQDALSPDAVVRPAHVRGLMRRLHGSNDVEFRKTDEIHGRDDLRVFDAVAAVARAVGFGDRFENVQRDAISAIADGVEGQLETSLVALNSHRRELFRIAGEDSARRGIVGIGLEHRGGARTHGSIRKCFQGARLQPGILGAALSSHILQLVERQIERQPLRDSNGKFAFFFQLLVYLKIRPFGIILDGSDAVPGGIFEHPLDSLAAPLNCGIGNPRFYQGHGRVFFQHSCRLTKRIVFDLTARRIGSVLVDLPALERERIRHGHVTGDVCEDDGILGSDGIELLAIGEFSVRPERVVPATAGDPFPFFVLGNGGGDALLHFFRGRHAR